MMTDKIEKARDAAWSLVHMDEVTEREAQFEEVSELLARIQGELDFRYSIESDIHHKKETLKDQNGKLIEILYKVAKC